MTVCEQCVGVNECEQLSVRIGCPYICVVECEVSVCSCESVVCI